MSDLVIRSNLADQIRQIARRHDQPVEDFLKSLLDGVRMPQPPLFHWLRWRRPPGESGQV